MYNGYANEDSYYFDCVWANDQNLYNAIVREGKRLLNSVPGMTPQTLGLNILNSLKAALNNGGWGWAGMPEAFVSIPGDSWANLVSSVNLANVNETEFGENVLDAIDNEN